MVAAATPMPQLLTRRSIWNLEAANPWDAYSLAYAKAVDEMRSRSSTDPTSWTFQAAMHGTYAPTPPGALWNQCQHGSWFFLPWHRMYLYWFERIVRSIVVSHGGPSDWALPFWNYSGPDPHNKVPPAFRLPTWNPGTGNAPNPLYTSHRAPAYNDPNTAAAHGLPASVVSLNALNATTFSGPPAPGFGGPVTGFSHQPQSFGLLENIPHNQVHVQVGGTGRPNCAGGWMTDPNCAAEDPIFWLHHANIDRLWSAWIAQGGGRANPATPNWLGEVFSFYDERGQQVRMTPAQVLDTVSQLNYEYEVPLFKPLPVHLAPVAASGAAPIPQGPPRLVAATQAPVNLGAARVDQAVSLPDPARTAIAAAVDPNDNSASFVYLNVEGLRAEEIPGVSWEVHLNLPADAGGGPGDYQVGVISFFGFREQLRADQADHSLGPMVHTFDITQLVQTLRQKGEWDESKVTVSFVPVGPSADEITTPPQVGRISISFH